MTDDSTTPDDDHEEEEPSLADTEAQLSQISEAPVRDASLADEEPFETEVPEEEE